MQEDSATIMKADERKSVWGSTSTPRAHSPKSRVEECNDEMQVDVKYEESMEMDVD